MKGSNEINRRSWQCCWCSIVCVWLQNKQDSNTLIYRVKAYMLS